MAGQDKESKLFRAWAEFVLAWRWPLLALTLVITGFFAWHMKQSLRFDSSVEYFAEGTEARALLEEFQEDFGNDTYHIVMVQGDVFTPEFLARLRQLHDAIEAHPFGTDAQPAAAPEDGSTNDFGSAADDAAGFGSAADDAAGFGTAADDAAGFGSAADDAAGFGTAADDAAGFGSAADDAAGFGSAADDAAGFGSAADDAAGFGSPVRHTAVGRDPDRPGAPQASAPDGEAGPQPVRIDEITSLINVRQTVFEGGAVRVRGLMDTPPRPAELPALKRQVLADPTLVGQLVGEDGEHTVIMLRTSTLDAAGREAVYHELQNVVRPFEAEGFDVAVSGMPALNAELVGTMQRDMRRLIGGAFFVMALVLLWLFRRVGGVVAPLIVVALAAIWTLGLMAFTNTPVTLLTNIVPAFLAAVGLGDSIHVQSVYRDGRQHGLDRHEAIVHAVASTGMPVLFTTLTTMVGLLSFRFAHMAAIAEMGSFAAFGVGVALLHSVTMLPIALSFIGQRETGRAEDAVRAPDRIDRGLAAVTSLSATKQWPVLAAGLAVVIIACVGVAQIEVYHNPVTWMKEDYPARIDLELVDSYVGGTAQVNLVVDAHGELGMRDLELLRKLEELDAYIRAYEDPRTGQHIVTGTSSLLDIIRETNRALHGGDQAFYALPDTQRGVSDDLLLFESAAPRDLRRLTTADLERSHITVRIHWMDATAYEPFTEYLQRGIDDIVGDAARVRPTGSVYELVTIVSGLIGDLIRSFGAAFASVTIMMVLLLRSPLLGGIAMIPNLVPVALVLGVMGYANIPMDLTNLLIASIVIGVAVDNTVHYMFQWREAFRTGIGMEASIEHALHHAGRALVGTAIILALGFGVYLFSSMINIQRFGLLVGSACVAALVTNLVLAPALLRLFYGRRDTA